MVSALVIEGGIIGLFVILDGLHIVALPTVNDEPQRYAISAIGIFILLATVHLSRKQTADTTTSRG